MDMRVGKDKPYIPWRVVFQIYVAMVESIFCRRDCFTITPADIRDDTGYGTLLLDEKWIKRLYVVRKEGPAAMKASKGDMSQLHNSLSPPHFAYDSSF